MFPGPTIEANQGDRIVVNVTNTLSNATYADELYLTPDTKLKPLKVHSLAWSVPESDQLLRWNSWYHRVRHTPWTVLGVQVCPQSPCGQR